jgi:hypothetical protein
VVGLLDHLDSGEKTLGPYTAWTTVKEANMALVDTVERVHSGVLHIVFFDRSGRRVASGSGFLSCGHFITNNHVFVAHMSADRVWLRREGDAGKQGLWLSALDFARRLVVGSTEGSFDYAVLDLPELANASNHQFVLRVPDGRKIGDSIALLGYPLEHDNLSCHAGIISSFYERGIVKIIQLDASVNAGNSGGPLIDDHTGHVLGIVSRRATGLSSLFGELRDGIKGNLELLDRHLVGEMFMGHVDPMKVMADGQRHVLSTLDEIERQANVGIGYAVSIEHLILEPSLRAAAGVQ